jgi:hypothetical protein
MRLIISLMYVSVSWLLSSTFVPDSPAQAKLAPNKDEVPPSYYGKVVEITKYTVTIKPQGNLKVYTHRNVGGVMVEESVYVQDNSRPPQSFVFDERLFPNSSSHVQRGHRISDVKVGDVIQISCGEFRGMAHCFGIEIYRRPGGKVPPAIGDDKTSLNRWDARMNGEQFAEEKVLPRLPRLFR